MATILRLWLICILLIAGYIAGITSISEVTAWTNAKQTDLQLIQ